MTATGAMRFGCCGGIADAPLIRDAGFDYIELPVGALMSATDDAAFRRIMENVGAFGIPVEACNVFIPATLKITGPEVEREPLWQYAALALQRMGEIGVRVCVFGSGGARSIPEGFDRAQALDQLAGVPRSCAGGERAAWRPCRHRAVEPQGVQCLQLGRRNRTTSTSRAA